MATWTRKPQERENQKYYFNGSFYVTAGVQQSLSLDEIRAIYNDVQAFVREKDGIDYLQVYVNERGEKLYFIDQLDKSMIASRDFNPEYHYCTLLLPSEY